MPVQHLALPYHRQEQEYTCTPACARMVLGFFGCSTDEDELARLLETTPDGTILLNLQRLECYGFQFVMRNADYPDLRAYIEQGIPVIVPVKTIHSPTWAPLDHDHSLVVAGAGRKQVAVYDPARGTAPDYIEAASFRAAWQCKNNRMAVLIPR